MRTMSDWKDEDDLHFTLSEEEETLSMRPPDCASNNETITPISLVSLHHISDDDDGSLSASILDFDYRNDHLNYCNKTFDRFLCWPTTPEKHIVTINCTFVLEKIFYSGTASRICNEGGIWKNVTDFTNCMHHAIDQSHSTGDESLEIKTAIYFGGYTLSLIGLIIALFIFLLFKELRCLRNTIHTHLIITYIMADTFWVLTSIQSHLVLTTNTIASEEAICITFILLHYFHLTNFFWMLVEGLYLYILVVQTFSVENIKLRLYAAIGWGLPLPIVIVWAWVKWITAGEDEDQLNQRPLDNHYYQDLVDNQACYWIEVDVYDWIYKVPAILVLCANLIFLTQIMFVLITKLRSATNPETQQSRKAAKALLVLKPLLGINYILFLSGSKEQPAYEYLRALLISTQGFMVALLYCFLNGEVRLAIRHRWNRIRIRGPFCNCCCSESRNNQDRSMCESLPRYNTESIRLHSKKGGSSNRKRHSSTTEITTTTTIAILGGNQNGGSNNPVTVPLTARNSLIPASSNKLYNLQYEKTLL